MKTKYVRILTAALLTLTALLAARQSAHAQFPAQGDDITQTLGQFTIVINPAFQPMMAGYPGYSGTTHMLTSPVLYDPTTIIGRSSVLHKGSAVDGGGVPVGTAGINVKDSMLVVQPGGLEPAGTREVHTTIYSLNLASGGVAVRAGTNATDVQTSPGQVESLSGAAGLPANDFPARSFFDIFVDVDLPAGGSFPGATGMSNSMPLMVQNTNLTSFPPQVVYIHGMSTAVPIVFRTSNPPHWNAGDTFGILTLAGHGVVGSNSVGNATTQLQNALASTPPAPVEPQYSAWSTATTTANTNMIFPAKGDDNTTSLGTFELAVNPTFQPFMSGYPGWNPSTKRLTSPLLYDPATKIGRSSPLTEGSTTDAVGVAVGTANTMVGDNNLVLFPPSFESPSNTFEVKTEVRSLNLAGGGAAVRAGTVASNVPGSYGQVESLSGASGDPYWDFPAKSFFDIFVDVDIPAGGGIPSPFTVTNTKPLIVQQNNLTTFPPKVIYVHGNSTAVPVAFTTAVPAIGAHAGDIFGILLLAGHGINFTTGSQDILQFQQAMQQMTEEPVDPQYNNWATGLNVPLQISSVPGIYAAPIIITGGTIQINGYCTANTTLILQSSPSLTNPNWTPVSSALGTSNATFTSYTTKSPSQTTTFYRMVDNTR